MESEHLFTVLNYILGEAIEEYLPVQSLPLPFHKIATERLK